MNKNESVLRTVKRWILAGGGGRAAQADKRRQLLLRASLDYDVAADTYVQARTQLHPLSSWLQKRTVRVGLRIGRSRISPGRRNTATTAHGPQSQDDGYDTACDEWRHAKAAYAHRINRPRSVLALGCAALMFMSSFQFTFSSVSRLRSP